MEHPTYTSDILSVALTTAYIFLGFIAKVSQSDLAFGLTVLVGVSTLCYNGIRIYKEFKELKQKK